MRVFKSPVSKFFSQKTTLGEFLLKLTPLTPAQIGEAATKGAVWIQRKAKGKILRIRSLKETILPEDVVQINFDPKVLSLPALTNIAPLFENANYGAWLKPAGAVPQGSQTGDHASMLRAIELIKGKEPFLVHRLDRETEGIMLVAYHSKAAALLSDLFLKNKITKTYLAIVLGEIPVGTKQTIKASLDDKEAITHIESLEIKNGKTLLKVNIDTGRLHQIRRHLDFIGHPVMGDPKYGKGNKNREGLKLLAFEVEFIDPWTEKMMKFTCPNPLTL